jgi:hypothetical protein
MRNSVGPGPPPQTNIQKRPAWRTTWGAHSTDSLQAGSAESANGRLVQGPRSAGAVACARCRSSWGRAGSAWVMPKRCQRPSASRTKLWSLTYQRSASPSEGS